MNFKKFVNPDFYFLGSNEILQPNQVLVNRVKSPEDLPSSVHEIVEKFLEKIRRQFFKNKP